MHAAAVVARAGLALIAITTCATAVAADASACYGAYYTHVDVLQAAPNHVIVSASALGTGYVTRDDKSPLKGAYGPCVLFNEVIDGKPNGELRCVRSAQPATKTSPAPATLTRLAARVTAV